MLDTLHGLRNFNYNDLKSESEYSNPGKKEEERNSLFGDKGIKECIEYCKNKNILFAIASSGSRIVIEIILCYLLYTDIIRPIEEKDGPNHFYKDPVKHPAPQVEPIYGEQLKPMNDHLIQDIYQNLKENKCLKEGIFITTTDDYKNTSRMSEVKNPLDGRRVMESKEVYNKNRMLNLISKSFLGNDKNNLIFFDDDTKGLNKNRQQVGNAAAAKADGYVSSIKIINSTAFNWETYFEPLINPKDFFDSLITPKYFFDKLTNNPVPNNLGGFNRDDADV